MAGKKKYRNTIVFVAFLLLAGMIHAPVIPSPFLDAIRFYVLNMIYIGLIFAWTSSVWQRLLPSFTRTCLVAEGVLFVLYMILRVYRYRIGLFRIVPARYAWYAFYIPLILVPTIFAIIGIRIRRSVPGRSEGRLSRIPEWIPILPGAVLTALVLTNDLHRLVFIPKIEPALLAGDDGTYSHGMMFYVLCVWIGLMLLYGILNLIWSQSQSHSYRKLAAPLLMAALWAGMAICEQAVPMPAGMHKLYNHPEIHTFGMMGILEACIRVRLIAHNESYFEFFRGLKVSAWITDRAMVPVYQTASAEEVPRDAMKQALNEPVHLQEHLILSGRPIRSGYVFWQEDESIVRELNERLSEANEILSEENEVLAREKELIREGQATEASSRLYAEAAKAVYPQQMQIAELLEEIRADQPEFREKIAEILVLISYVKRKSNFVLIRQERERIEGDELASALQETAHYLGYLGVHVTVDAAFEGGFPCQTAIGIYDTIFAILQDLGREAAEIWIRMDRDEFRIYADCLRIPDLQGLPLPAAGKIEDEQLLVTISVGGAS